MEDGGVSLRKQKKTETEKKNRETRKDINCEIKEPETRRDRAERQEDMGAGEGREILYTEFTNTLQVNQFPFYFA